VKTFKQKVLSLKSLFKKIFFSQPSFKKGLPKSLKNHSLIGSNCQYPFISLLSVVVKVFMYQESHLRSEAILVSTSLCFSSVYSIYLSASPHVSRSHLYVKHNRFPDTHKQSLQSTNHFYFSYTFFSSSFHSVQKKLHPHYCQFYPTTKPKSLASFPMIQSTKYFQCSQLMLPLVHYNISENLHNKSPDEAMMSFAMTAAQCLYMPGVCDSTLL
jgi:hypothetical protein